VAKDASTNTQLVDGAGVAIFEPGRSRVRQALILYPRVLIPVAPGYVLFESVLYMTYY
jgi:hypothetical protein